MGDGKRVMTARCARDAKIANNKFFESLASLRFKMKLISERLRNLINMKRAL